MVSSYNRLNMKRFTYLFLAISTLICSCSTFDEPLNEVNISLGDLYAGFDEDTRTYVKNDKYLRWNEGDCLTVFYGNTVNCQYKFNGATGDNSGSFSYVSSGDLETGNALGRIYAVYPYNEATTITDGGQISLTLPAVQTYAENSFGRGANTMLAVTKNAEGTFLAFKNACGYLKLKLYNADGATIKSVLVKGNAEEKIAGATTATIAYGEVPQLTMADNATTAITLDCGDGVSLGTTEETATEFWVVIPETTFEGGITVTVTDTEGGIFEKSTTKEVVIERNAILPMEALEVEFAAPVVKPANNEIWYTNGSTTKKTAPNYLRFGGATIVSNSYDAEKDCWVITFSGEVTEIGNSVFKQCSSLSSVTIPDSVTEIADYAFQYCSSLESVTIGNSVTSIGMYAFFECSGLESVTIPDSVTEIKGSAFAYCSSLECVTIGDSVTSIGYAAFRDCSSLSSLTIPDSVTEIGEEAFYYCSSLESVTIGDGITSIGNYAINGCSSLTEFKGKFASEDGRCLVMDGVLYSFAPAGLTAYTIPDSVTLIGHTSFANCSNLASITISGSVTEIGEEAFNKCSSLESITIPDSVTKIGEGAFTNCSSLSNATISDSVTEIGGYAFYACKSLTSITIPDSVNSIGNCTFYDCSNLMSVTIGDGITSIGHAAFYDCTSLESVYCKAMTPPSFDGTNVFDYNASGRKIYVPTEALEEYRTAENWSDYAIAIVAYDFENLMVDMGLSVKWARVNIGANSPEELGNLYAWGEVSSKATYDFSNYSWWNYDDSEDGDGWWSLTTITKYGSSYSNANYIRDDGYYDSYSWVNDGFTVLDFEDDVARTKWGGAWRMPTQAECQELVDNCTIEKVKYNNCDGFLFTSTKEGYTDKSLFFPLTPSTYSGDETYFDNGSKLYSGLFWSSTQYLPFPVCAYAFRSSYPYTSCTLGPITRQTGFPVRPVK